MNRANRNLFQHFYEDVGLPAPSIDLVKYALGERPYYAMPDFYYRMNNILKKMYIPKNSRKNERAHTHITPDYHMVGHSPIYHGLNWDNPIRHEAFMQACFDIHKQASEELMDAMFSEAWFELDDNTIKRRIGELYPEKFNESWVKKDDWEAELMDSIEINRRKFQFWLDVKCFVAGLPESLDIKWDFERPLLNIDTRTTWGHYDGDTGFTWMPRERIYGHHFGVDPIW